MDHSNCIQTEDKPDVMPVALWIAVPPQNKSLVSYTEVKLNYPQCYQA